MALKIDGKQTAHAIKQELADRVQKLQEKGYTPGLGTILVGNDPASQRYVAGKHADCAEVGIRSLRVDLPENATQEEVLQAVAELNANEECTGYIVQLPLPKHIDEQQVLAAIDPQKDADGLHPYNLGELVLRVTGEIDTPLPCTPRGIVELLDRYGIDCDGKHVCVLGRGITIGRSIGLLLTRRGVDATVTLCHTHTRDIAQYVRQADIVIAAVGSAYYVQPEWVKPGTVLVDVGVSRVFDESEQRWRIRGDIDPKARQQAAAYTPNPGGVGPMTRAMLLANVVDMAERIVERSK